MNAPVESRTLAEIYTAAKDKGWTRADVSAFTIAMFGHMPESMTEREAQAVLSHLDERLYGSPR